MMIHNDEFQPVKNSFLSKLNEDVKTIKSTKESLISTDKSYNIYKMDKDKRNKYLTEKSPKHIRNLTETKSTKSTLKPRKLPQS